MWLFVIVIFVGLYCFNYANSFTFWTKLKVKQSPQWTAIIENFQTTTKKLSIMDYLSKHFDIPPNTSRYVGLYLLGRPILLLRDPELIRQMMIRDRDIWLNRQVLAVNGNDPFWDSTLFALKDDKWHSTRTTVSPAFTAIKIKSMFVLIEETTQEFVKYLRENVSKQEEYKMKEIFRRYGADIIANCAFGQLCNSLKERDNEFYKNGVKLSNYHDLKKSFKIAVSRISLAATKFFDFKEYDPIASEFFLKIIQGQVKARLEKNIVRPDMLELLIEARREQNNGKGNDEDVQFTDEEMTAQAMSFFLAGFDTFSTTLSFATYELALHQLIQERLRDEINQTLEDCNGKLTYDGLMEMKYLDMFVSETLRKWPPGIYIDRISSEKYTIKKSPIHSQEPEKLILNKNTSIFAPIYMIQHDPENFPDPEVFNPERFSDANKKNIKPYSYFPFGIGPRGCIGIRFALMEVKVVLFHLLYHFEILTNANTQIPVQLRSGLFNLESCDGILLSFRKLN